MLISVNSKIDSQKVIAKQLYNFNTFYEHLQIELIKTSMRVTPRDNEGTETFIQIIISNDVQKKLVCQMVYLKMKKNIYIVSNEIKNSGNKCFQKWRNFE